MPGKLRLRAEGFKRAIMLCDPGPMKAAARTAAMKESLALRNSMVEAFREQKGTGRSAWAPISDATIALRRSEEKRQEGGRAMGTKALVATGQMRKAIQVISGKDEVFIGIPRGVERQGPSVGEAGEGMINLALIHEFGVVMRWTVKQRAWFWNSIRKAGNSYSKRILRGQKDRTSGAVVSLLIIPPRPFITPAIEAWSQDLQSRLGQGFHDALALSIAKREAAAAKESLTERFGGIGTMFPKKG